MFFFIWWIKLSWMIFGCECVPVFCLKKFSIEICHQNKTGNEYFLRLCYPNIRSEEFYISNSDEWCTVNHFILVHSSFEPSHEIMALFVLRKLILQPRMRSHPVGLDVWFLAGPFIYFHTSCVRTAKALVRLPRCAGSPEPSLVA